MTCVHPATALSCQSAALGRLNTSGSASHSTCPSGLSEETKIRPSSDTRTRYGEYAEEVVTLKYCLVCDTLPPL